MACEDCKDCDLGHQLVLCKDDVDKQYAALRNDVECLKEIQQDVKDLLNIFDVLKNTQKGMVWAGKGIRFTAITAAAIGTIIAVAKGGIVMAWNWLVK